MRHERNGVRLRQQNARQYISTAAEYEHYTLIAGIIIGAFFGLLIGFGW